ncbi:MAG: hypothetical protein LBI81_03485 [Puniceicoccales bacterium]|jgi:hypothetical protein|nr:hypothetical protein [Puniceicoccales bacterium]
MIKDISKFNENLTGIFNETSEHHPYRSIRYRVGHNLDLYPEDKRRENMIKDISKFNKNLTGIFNETSEHHPYRSIRYRVGHDLDLYPDNKRRENEQKKRALSSRQSKIATAQQNLPKKKAVKIIFKKKAVKINSSDETREKTDDTKSNRSSHRSYKNNALYSDFETLNSVNYNDKKMRQIADDKLIAGDEIKKIKKENKELEAEKNSLMKEMKRISPTIRRDGKLVRVVLPKFFTLQRIAIRLSLKQLKKCIETNEINLNYYKTRISQLRTEKNELAKDIKQIDKMKEKLLLGKLPVKKD